MTILANPRELREFIEAKERKREPIIITTKAVAASEYRPSGARGFANYRAALRREPDWGPASERLDALGDALFRRHGIEIPTPRLVLTNEDRSLSLFWRGSAMARCFVDGFVCLVAGPETASREITNDFLDALRLEASMPTSP